MAEHQEHTTGFPENDKLHDATELLPEHPEIGAEPVLAAQAETIDADDWHAEAGRKGAQRVQQLIEKGKLYEQEHGLKRGRQRLRQLIELGKLYESEHGLRPRTVKRRERLKHGQRQELLADLLRCLIHLAKPSFRADLDRLLKELPAKSERAA
jgi:hypothetical protein